ncbi:hypothetical protein [Longispora urticae]
MDNYKLGIGMTDSDSLHPRRGRLPRGRRMGVLAVAVLTVTAGLAFVAGPAHAAGACTIDSDPAEVIDGRIHGTDESDLIQCTAGVQGFAIYAGDGDDDIIFNEPRDSGIVATNITIYSGNGDDTIEFKAPDNGSASYSGITVNAGPGADNVKFWGELSDSTINGDDDNDTMSAFDVSGVTFNGDDGDDTINLYAAPHEQFKTTLNGGEGNDTLFAPAVHNESVVNGDNGDDIITIGSLSKTYVGNGTVSGGAGNDHIEISFLGLPDEWTNGAVRGDGGDDTITAFRIYRGSLDAGDGADTITVEYIDGGGLVNGGDGDDTIGARDNGDTTVYGTLDGGNGTDTCRYRYVAGTVTGCP